MFVLGHAGIGARLGACALGTARPVPLRALYLGTLLPDLIDKPLYYALSFATGRHGAELGLISGTRTFGHSALLALALFALVRWRGSADAARALLAGLATHWLLDLGGDWAGAGLAALGFSEAQPPGPGSGPGTISAILFPLLGLRFPVIPFRSVTEHLLSLRAAYTLAGEAIGGALLLAAWRARKRRPPGPPTPPR